MGALGIVALVVLLVLVACGIALWLALAMMPGRIARQRAHPQADAINICGWIGALTLGVFSPIAFIWAFSRSPLQSAITDSTGQSDSSGQGAGQGDPS